MELQVFIFYSFSLNFPERMTFLSHPWRDASVIDNPSYVALEVVSCSALQFIGVISLSRDGRRRRDRPRCAEAGVLHASTIAASRGTHSSATWYTTGSLPSTGGKGGCYR